MRSNQTSDQKTAHALVRIAGRGLLCAAGAAAGAYAARAAATWLRYGDPKPPPWRERDAVLDCFMPSYEVAEYHRIVVAAPADITLAAARELSLEGNRIVRAIIAARERILGAARRATADTRGLVESAEAMGWRRLIDDSACALVFGAVTQPWEANVVFRSIPPEQFAAFDEPGYVKIAWTLSAEPLGPRWSIARTETRAVATDAESRAKFRRYWSLFSPGIVLIRYALLSDLKREAEHRAGLALGPSIRPPRGWRKRHGLVTTSTGA